MSTRVLAGVAFAIVGVVLLCSGLTTALVFGGGEVGACVATSGAASSTVSSTVHRPALEGVGAAGGWSGVQVGNAAAIVAVGMRLGVPARGWVIAVATAMQESSLVNRADGDRDSVGLFQQRPSQGWGTPEQLRDARYAASAFYRRLLAVAGWQVMPLAEAAQRVQRSAYPDAYGRWEREAARVVAAVSADGAALAACRVPVSARGWTQPVDAVVGSGFRIAGRPGHDGVDLIAAKGTAVRAASAGTVAVVRCDAVDVRTGRGWGCDRDGDPVLTRGCGWYVDVVHGGRVVTRYCHLLTRPRVVEGQQVAAGEVIGVSGSSGHSSGPHLHFEVHLGDHTSGTAVDPVEFMTSVGAPLHGQRER